MAQAGRIYDSYHEYDADGYIVNDRFYVRSNVYLPSSEVDPRTGMLRDDIRRHGRTQALRMEKERLDQEYQQLDTALQKRRTQKGIRVSLRKSLFSLFLLTAFLFVALLVQQGMLVQRQRSLRTVMQRIEEVKTANNDLNAKIAEASDAATICYTAARDLGMVPADSAQAIHLIAVETRPSGPSQDVSVTADAQTIPTGVVAASSVER